MEYKGIIGLPELDIILISYIDIEQLIVLININPYIKRLVIQSLPNIVSEYYDLEYEDNEELCCFALDLIIFMNIDVLNELIKLYDNFKNYKINKFYGVIGKLIISEHLDNYRLVNNYFKIAPNGYDWSYFNEKLCNHYYISYFDEHECLEHFESLNLLMRTSKSLHNYDFEYLLYDINNSYKLHIEDYENSHSVICMSVKDIISKNDLLLRSSEFCDKLLLDII